MQEVGGGGGKDFNWRSTPEEISIPVMQTLFNHLIDPVKLDRLNLESVISRAEDALNRIDRVRFLEEFESEKAIQHFYQPFLKEFDADSQVDLGVFYTPPEIVKFQVERVDRVLREELGIVDGLANDNVNILDPCCGTGAYVIEVLRKIEETLRRKADDGLVGNTVKKAAMNRVMGFEIMPAPFLVAHWRVNEFLASIGASPMSKKGKKKERAKIILANALSEWDEKTSISEMFFDIRHEHNLAMQVKHDTKIQVVIGNPPYNAFAGVAPPKEGNLTEPYEKRAKEIVNVGRVNMHDLYVRFFRIAEMRIEDSGRGVVSYITSNSWISGKSFAGMRHHFMEIFDKAWIEDMKGSVFKIKGFSKGIEQSVATTLLVKKETEGKECSILYRIVSMTGEAGRAHLHESLSVEPSDFESLYGAANPDLPNNFSFQALQVNPHYLTWPDAHDLCKPSPGCYNIGMHEGRSGALFAMQEDDLTDRMKKYFNREVSWEELELTQNGLTIKKSCYDPKKTREKVFEKGEVFNEEMIAPYTVRPFDVQLAYYANTPSVWNRRRENMWKQHFGNDMFLVSQTSQKSEFGRPATISKTIGDMFILSGDTELFPFHDYTAPDGMLPESKVANLSENAKRWLGSLGLPNPDSDERTASLPWLHMLSICNSPQYISENEDGLRIDRPRFPVPDNIDTLRKSTKIGDKLAIILDGKQNKELPKEEFPDEVRRLGLVKGNELLVSGWGSYDKEGSVQPSKRILKSRPWEPDEKIALQKIFKSLKIEQERGLELLGDAVDIDLNCEDDDPNQWCGVPENVWKLRIGRYQVIRKWLSYRDFSVLGRKLDEEDEARHVSNMTQRLTLLLLMTDDLDANYRSCCENAWHWPNENTP